MGLTPLTPAQQSALDTLARGGRIESVAPDRTRAAAFLDRAADALADVARVRHAHTAYNLAYDACHDVGEAILAAYGYRTRAAAGQHEALGRFLRVVLSAPPADAAARTFDQLRRARNANRYDARPVGQAQVSAASSTADALIAAARARGVGG